MKKSQFKDETVTMPVTTADKSDQVRNKPLKFNRFGINLSVNLTLPKTTSKTKRKVSSPGLSNLNKIKKIKQTDELHSSNVSIAGKSDCYNEDSDVEFFSIEHYQRKLVSKFNELEFHIKAFINERNEFKRRFEDSLELV